MTDQSPWDGIDRRIMPPEEYEAERARSLAGPPTEAQWRAMLEQFQRREASRMAREEQDRVRLRELDLGEYPG